MSDLSVSFDTKTGKTDNYFKKYKQQLLKVSVQHISD